MFKIGYFADGPWSHNALELILREQSISIAFIVPRNDTKDEFLKMKAEENNIPYLCPISVNSEEFYNLATLFDCDLFVSMSYNQIFKSKIMNLPKYGTINCHAGKLPFYRGRNILNWVLINDEKEFGITVHYVDEGIDTGDIILQRCFPITDQDNYKTLLEVSYVECANILYEALKQISNGSATRINQNTIDKYGMYCGMRKSGDELIDWNHTSRDLFNFVRAVCRPGPMACTFFDNYLIKINKVEYSSLYPQYKGIPGQVLLVDDDFFVVKTLDSYLKITEYTSDCKIKPGMRLK